MAQAGVTGGKLPAAARVSPPSPGARPGKRLVAGVLLGMLLLVVGRLVINATETADLLVGPLLVADTGSAAGAIVVLGAGVIGDCIANHYGVRRVLHGVRAWRARRAPLVMFTGGTGNDSCPVAQAQARLAQEIGLPPEALLVETEALSTRENAERSAALLRSRGIDHVVLITDQLHMRRAASSFSAVGIRVERASVPIHESHVDNVDMLVAAARESVALGYYGLKGWLGPVDTSEPERSGVDDPSRKIMQGNLRYKTGPVVILGASYAGSWDVATIGAVPVVNRGVAGQQSFEMLERFDRDVPSAQPRAVILWGFINDIFRNGDDIDGALVRVRDSFQLMIDRARELGIEPILATEVPIRAPDSWSETVGAMIGPLLGKESYQDRINQAVLTTNRWLTELAIKEGLFLLDFHKVLAENGVRRRREFTAQDGSHITSAGYAAITQYATPILQEHLVVR